MSWNSEGFFEPSTCKQQYTGYTPYQLRQEYHSLSQSYSQCSSGDFTPSPYGINLQLNNTQFYRPNDYTLLTTTSAVNDDDSNELRLLEELGINIDHILRKTKSILNSFATLDLEILNDVDHVGPLVFCLAFALSFTIR